MDAAKHTIIHCNANPDGNNAIYKHSHGGADIHTNRNEYSGKYTDVHNDNNHNPGKYGLSDSAADKNNYALFYRHNYFDIDCCCDADQYTAGSCNAGNCLSKPVQPVKRGFEYYL